MRLRFGTLGDDQQATRILVDAMDETDVGVGWIIEGIILQVVRECIDQRAGIVAVTWVDDEPRRLVDDYQHLIFVDDIQRYGLGDDLELVLGTAQLEGDDVKGLDAVVALDGLVADEDIAPIECLLDATTTATRHACSQVLVDAHRSLPLVSYDTEVLIEW